MDDYFTECDARRITYPCPHDNSMQPAVIHIADGNQPRPLVVALHTWSAGCEQTCKSYAAYAASANWNMIFPDFRGANWNCKAMGSDYAVFDIAAAVAFMKATSNVDNDRIYLTGGSGGGYGTLLFAGRLPSLWAAASAWCPISDIAAWHCQCFNTRFAGYAKHIEMALGGDPDSSRELLAEANRRSALPYLPAAANIPMDIASGLHDGHTGSVPISQALNAFNVLAAPQDRVPEADIAYMVANEAVPPGYPEPSVDPAYPSACFIHFRRVSRNVRITIFEGGHSLLNETAMLWLSHQRKGQPPFWNVGDATNAAEAVELAK